MGRRAGKSDYLPVRLPSTVATIDASHTENIDMKSISLFLLALLFSSMTIAAEHKVEMRNIGKDGAMVFEPAYLKVAVGDTVHFVPADMGHNSVSVLVPEGAKGWAGERNKDVTAVIDKEGVYIYRCEPHTYMAMTGVIQAGKPVNLEAAKKAAEALKPQFAVNKDRLDRYLSQVQ